MRPAAPRKLIATGSPPQADGRWRGGLPARPAPGQESVIVPVSRVWSPAGRYVNLVGHAAGGAREVALGD
jgi:hypothetical protein